MNVEGYCLATHTHDWIPAIPAALIVDGQFFTRDKAVDKAALSRVDIPAVFVPDGYWIGVEGSGACTILSPVEERKWCVNRSSKAVEESQQLMKGAGNALRAVHMLHAAAGLVGLRIPDLMHAISTLRKDSNEPLEVVIARIKDIPPT